MSPRRKPAGGTLVLDCEGLAKYVDHDRRITRWLDVARSEDLRVVASAATLVEVVHPRIDRAALDWALSRVVVEPVTAELAEKASALLGAAGMHGHRHALDAMVAATALAATHPVTVLTSDHDDLTSLCGGQVTLIKV